MLTEEKKQLIEVEERYRHEISSKIKEDIGAIKEEVEIIEHTIWAKVNELLNSNVGMWFLSTVLVTGGAGAYQATQHHYEVKLRNHTQVITHQFEISNRIQNMKYFLRKATTCGEAELALKSVFQSKTPVSPDIEKLSLLVIYFNFYQLTDQPKKETLEIVRQLEDEEYLLQQEKPSTPFPEATRTRLLNLLDQLERIQVSEASQHR